MDAQSPFESIESTHEFFTLLADTVSETRKDIEQDAAKASNGDASRRLDALRLAVYNLEKLQLHVAKSRRILNDLRSIRRLLFEERGTTSVKAQPKTGLPKTEPAHNAPAPVAKFAVALSSHVSRPDARPQTAAVA